MAESNQQLINEIQSQVQLVMDRPEVATVAEEGREEEEVEEQVEEVELDAAALVLANHSPARSFFPSVT